MKDCSADAPIIFDVTHALQTRAAVSGGRRAQIAELGRALCLWI